MINQTTIDAGISDSFFSRGPSVAPLSMPAPTSIPIGIPILISIPRLQLENVDIQEVTTDSFGKMGIPQDSFSLGWYRDGVRPGELGSAVLAGHYDMSTGAPAIFYNLHTIELGDSIQIQDSNGMFFTFIVEEKKLYHFEEAPIDTIFYRKDAKRLNLITCAGVWDVTQHNYNQRVVVYARLVE
ncbi:MAG: class F sortase [Candidatus Roizmanbacteria bacterium]